MSTVFVPLSHQLYARPTASDSGIAGATQIFTGPLYNYVCSERAQVLSCQRTKTSFQLNSGAEHQQVVAHNGRYLAVIEEWVCEMQQDINPRLVKTPEKESFLLKLQGEPVLFCPQSGCVYKVADDGNNLQFEVLDSNLCLIPPNAFRCFRCLDSLLVQYQNSELQGVFQLYVEDDLFQLRYITKTGDSAVGYFII